MYSIVNIMLFRTGGIIQKRKLCLVLGSKAIPVYRRYAIHSVPAHIVTISYAGWGPDARSA